MASSKSIQIRKARPEDDGAIAKLSGELGYETNQRSVNVQLNQLLESHDHGIFVAMNKSDEVIGWIHVYTSHRLMVEAFADLGGMVVTESLRGCGVGTQLLQAAERWTTSKDLGKLRIRSKVSRENAHQFYSSKKYAVVKSQRVFEKSFPN